MTVNTLDGAFGGGKSRGGAWLLPLAPIAISIFAISALVSYHLRADAITPRTMAQSVVIGIYDFLGWVPACMFFGLVFAWSSIWFVAGSIERPLQKLARVFLLTLALAVFGNLDASAAHTGALGAWIGGGLSSVLGSFLSHLVMAPLTFLALLFATDYFWMSYFERRVLERTKAELQSAAAAVSDAGVEPAVPEEFKQLARSLPPEAHASAADSAEEDVDVEAYFDRLEQRSEVAADTAEVVDEQSADAETDSDATGEEPVRLSYFERRRLREEREALRALQNAAGVQPEDEVSEVAEASDVETEVVADETFVEAVEAERVEVAATAESDAESAPREPRFAPASEHDATHSIAAEAFERADEGSDSSVTNESVEFAVEAQAATTSDEADLVEVAPTLAESPRVESEPVLFAGLGEALPDQDASAAAADVEVAAEASDVVAAEGAYEVRTEPLFPSAFAHVEVATEGTEDEVEAAAAEADSVSPVDEDVQPAAEPEEFAEPKAEQASPAESLEADRSASEPDVVEGEALEDEFDETAVEEGIRILGPIPASELSEEAPPAEDAAESQVAEERTVEIPAMEPVADLSAVRPRGFLAPVVEDDSEAEASESDAEAAAPSGATDAVASSDEEPLVAIPRAEESPRQKSLFGNAADEALLREAQEICESAHRPSAVLLQRKLRIDYEMARAVLAQLAERGVVELEEDGSHARVRS